MAISRNLTIALEALDYVANFWEHDPYAEKPDQIIFAMQDRAKQAIEEIRLVEKNEA